MIIELDCIYSTWFYQNNDKIDIMLSKFDMDPIGSINDKKVHIYRSN